MSGSSSWAMVNEGQGRGALCISALHDICRSHRNLVLVTLDGVGKSTLITSLIKESYVANVRPTSANSFWRQQPSCYVLSHVGHNSKRSVFLIAVFPPTLWSIGSACHSGSHYPPRSHSRQCDNPYCGYIQYVMDLPLLFVCRGYPPSMLF